VLRALIWSTTGDKLRATRVAAIGGRLFAWLLMGAGLAMALGAHVPINQLLTKVPVTRLMRRDTRPVEPTLALTELVDDYVIGSCQRAFPVVRDGRLLGIVSLADLNQHPRLSWSQLRVVDVMTPFERVVTITADQNGVAAVVRLAEHQINELPVVDGDRLLGVVQRGDRLKWLFVHGRDDDLAVSRSRWALR